MQTVCWWVMTLEFTTVQWKSLGAKNDFDLFDRDLDSSSDPKIQGHTLTLAWFLWIYHADKHTHTHTHTHTMDWVVALRISQITHLLMSKHSDTGCTCTTPGTAGKWSGSTAGTGGGTRSTIHGKSRVALLLMDVHTDLRCTGATTGHATKMFTVRFDALAWFFLRVLRSSRLAIHWFSNCTTDLWQRWRHCNLSEAIDSQDELGISQDLRGLRRRWSLLTSRATSTVCQLSVQ